VLTLSTVLTFPPLVFSQIRMFQDSHWFLFYAPFMLFGTLCFALSLGIDGMSKPFDLAEHKRVVAMWRPLWYPSVDVFMPTCGEPIEVLRNAWTYVDALRTNYRGPLTPYVLDDAARPEVRAMAKEFGFAYASRPNRGWYLKSGNLKYGFQISSGKYILLLDADFAPRADLLDETLPYLERDPKVGIVQTPQFFHVSDQQTWIERGAGSVQELFYRSIQTARANKDGAICVGSCAIYRRAALAQNDGMSLAHHSEDLHTGFDLYLLGWQLSREPHGLRQPAVSLVLGHDEPARQPEVLAVKDPALYAAVLSIRLRRLHLHRGIHIRGAIAGNRHPHSRPAVPGAEKHDLRSAGPVLCGRHFPHVASFAVPARSVGGAHPFRLGSPVRAH
jgi:cellulose synthase (UDP-forming)